MPGVRGVDSGCRQEMPSLRFGGGGSAGAVRARGVPTSGQGGPGGTDAAAVDAGTGSPVRRDKNAEEIKEAKWAAA